MKRVLVAFGSVTLALTVLVCFVVYKPPDSSSGAIDDPGVDVVVAANDLQAGTRLGEKDIRVVSFPVSMVLPKCFRSKSRVVGRVVIFPIRRSECTLPDKVAAENADPVRSLLIPPGMRAVSVRVNEVMALAGFVVSGTRVDVALPGNPTSDNQRQTTVLENVAVIAVGRRLERNAAGDPQTSPVITLLVSPNDARKLTLANANEGRIHLALRGPFDHRRIRPQMDPPMVIPLKKAAHGRNNG